MSKGNVLLVDDTPENLSLLSNILKRKGYKARCAISGEMALKTVQSNPPDVILLDINMPDMNGYEVCHQLKSNEATSIIPVIFVSAYGEVIDKVRAFEFGGIDYVTKPFQADEVLARVQTQIALKLAHEEVQNLNLHLEERVRESTEKLIQETQERHRVQSLLLHQASYDELTGLPNRFSFIKELELSHRSAANATIAVLSIDCKCAALINNALGHEALDQLLVATAKRLQAMAIPQSYLAKISGGAFLLLCKNVSEKGEVLDRIADIERQFHSPLEMESTDIYVNLNIGIAFGQAQVEPTHLVRNAQTAMSQAKQDPSVSHCVYDPRMNVTAKKMLILDMDLRKALKQREFVVHYQPIISLESGNIVGLEALARWQHPKLGLIPPQQFIPAAERSGLIVPLGYDILRQACAQMANWQATYLHLRSLKISVNVSVRQFSDINLLHQITDCLQQVGLAQECLQLEIAESAIMENLDSASVILEQLQAFDIELAIDDFGTGYSSLSHLSGLPVNMLKVDRDYIKNIEMMNRKRLGVLEAMLSLARALDMAIVAKGIETPEQYQKLAMLGCTYGQGFFFSKPLPASEMESFLADCDQSLELAA